jgi:uncharacterized protein YutE (UPF0331/DUF86 family)
MTNLEIVAKKLAFVEQCIADLRTKAKPEQFGHDLLQRRFAEHTLQLAIQAALDVASHIVSDERLGEPKTNAELFAALTRAGLVPQELGIPLAKMAGFRNVLVHAYVEVDVALLAQVVRERLEDLERFVSAVRAHLAL